MRECNENGEVIERQLGWKREREVKAKQACGRVCERRKETRRRKGRGEVRGEGGKMVYERLCV
jgi:hypothetical protein